MLEGPSKDTDLVWEARLEGMAPEIDGKVYVTEFEGVNNAAELPAPGSLAAIEITESKDYDLIGRVVEFEKPSSAVGHRQQAPAPSPFPILA
jgi:ribosomal protein S12 methylthiotransferase